MDGQELKEKFDHQWGAFRRFIATNPLAGFWTGVTVGTAFGFLFGMTMG